MPVDVNYLKQRITEVLDAKAELKRLTLKRYAELSLDEKYAVRYHVIVLAEALGSMCLHIAKTLSKSPCHTRSVIGLWTKKAYVTAAKI
jgi:uncharacterized protein YutE (UPF0331/DUF86 family)